MSLIGLLVLLVIAFICGALGQSIAGRPRGGCLVAILTGFIGALLGKWLAVQLGLPVLLSFQIDGEPFPFLWSIVGAALFTALLSMIGGGAPPKAN